MDDFLYWVGTSPWGWVVMIVGGLLFYGIISAVAKAPGAGMQKLFQDLGELKGKSLSEIVSKVGSPSSVSATGDGGTLRQWMATGYHIALIFDENEICLGVSHEASV